MSKSRSAAANHPSVEVINTTDIRLPRMSFAKMADAVFAREYSLSIAVIASKRAQVLNATYRNKTYIPNVLSFPLSKDAGEIILNIAEAKRQYASGMVEGTWRAWIALLVIHSMLHLNGIHHGRTMERQLEKILADNGFRVRLSVPLHAHDKTHHHRN